MAWDPEVYLRFADQRTRPAADLLARVALDAPRLVVDLGCGPGNSTALLARRWPEARLIGVDTASAMLERARAEGPSAEWILADAAAYEPPAPADLIFGNALLHWIPNHGAAFPKLMDRLAPGGVLAIQMPDNFDAPSHTGLSETAREGPWAEKVADLVRARPVGTPEFYYGLLRSRCAALDIWATEYLHILTGAEAVLNLGARNRTDAVPGAASGGGGGRLHGGLCRPAGARLSPTRRSRPVFLQAAVSGCSKALEIGRNLGFRRFEIPKTFRTGLLTPGGSEPRF